MNHLTDERLLDLNRRGLIPGPLEEEDAFEKRAEYCLHLPEHLELPIQTDVLEKPNIELQYFYDVVVDWIPVIFSNERLAPWHGGCAWIFQFAENTPTAAMIQLRQVFGKQPRYLGIYDRDELLTHELVHVGRMKFEERRFEEMLAYETSTSAFRRWFGPLIQSSWESVLFVMVLAAILVFDIFLVAVGHHDGYEIAAMLKLIPLAMLLMALIRLAVKRRQYGKCLARLESCLQSGHSARAVAYRLTDKEIVAFGSLSDEKVREYARLQSKEELRWKTIVLAYFS
jgi:hypothetical protein